MPQYILDMLDEKGIAWSLHSAIDDVMAEVDILYMTRVQKERLIRRNMPTSKRSSSCAPPTLKGRALT